ncbi:MAG: hypothetical protein IPK87_13345 [Planctomycetes bacterium]|nr:hypothetical protein [Planctomycetota bacterium]
MAPTASARWHAPIAYLLTTTTYGTWLHGDERGSVNRHGWSDRTRYLGPDPELEAHRRKLMKQPAFTFDAVSAGAVDCAIREHCTFKQWPLRALNVRTNHFHAVVLAVHDGARMLGAMKSRATRVLREGGLVAEDREIWTKRGAVTLLLTQEEVSAAVRYVEDGQGPDLSA